MEHTVDIYVLEEEASRDFNEHFKQNNSVVYGMYCTVTGEYFESACLQTLIRVSADLRRYNRLVKI